MIYSLRTIDGIRGTAEGILKTLNRQSEKEYKIKHKKKYISECMMLSIKTTNEHKVFRKVYIKYLIMRVRAKISFMALVKRLTIVELFLRAIEKSYTEIQEEGSIPKTKPETLEKMRQLMLKLNNGQLDGVMRLVMYFNDPERFKNIKDLDNNRNLM